MEAKRLFRLTCLILVVTLAGPALAAGVSPAQEEDGPKALPVETIAAWALTGYLLANDPAVTAGVKGRLASPAADSLMPKVTMLGEAPGVVGVVGGLYVAGEQETAGEALAAAVYSGLLTTGLKWAVGRGRPDSNAPNSVHYLGGRPGSDSFPSGHTAEAFALARVLARRYPKQRYLFYAAAGAVGLSRIYLDRHWAGDVAAGALIGVYSAGHAGSLPVLRFTF